MDISSYSQLQWYALIIVIFVITKYLRIYTEDKSRYASRIIAIGLAVTLSIISAWRSGLGDTVTYVNHFLNVSTNPIQVIRSISITEEWGFYALASIIKLIFGSNTYIYLLICALLIYVPLFYSFDRITKEPDFCFLLFALCGSWISSMNGMRQAMCASWFISSIGLISEKKYFKSAVICLLLCLIHKSAIVLVVALPFLNQKPWGGGTFVLLLFFIIIYISYPITSGALTYLIQGSRYEGYTNNITTGENSANILRALVNAVPLILAYIERDQFEDDPFYAICVHASIFNFGFMLLATARSWIIARLCMYFNSFSLALLCQSIKKSSEGNRVIIYYGAIIAYMIYFSFEI